MFPTLRFFLYDLFGIDVPFLEIVNTFGLFVAFAIAAAYWAMQTEFIRKAKLGIFPTKKVQITVGAPATTGEYISNAVLAFLFGYKIIWLAASAGPEFAPQDHIFTSEGNMLLGLLFAALSGGYRYYADRNLRKSTPQVKTVDFSIGDEMGNITTVALVSGFLGAKIFHILETPENFSFTAIVSQIFTTGGWTFYGGLICGALGVLVYASRKGYYWVNVLDAGGPAMMLSYGIGRFGCHFAGDGDWGIVNTNPKSFLPDWAWAYKYPHNVLGKDYAAMGMEPIPGCMGDYCHQLSMAVYPTPLYEAIMGLVLFYFLWKVFRFKGDSKPGQSFAFYMMFAGIERFLIEFIREHGDSIYQIGSMHFSQAQMISLLLMLGGGALWYASERNLYNIHRK